MMAVGQGKSRRQSRDATSTKQMRAFRATLILQHLNDVY